MDSLEFIARFREAQQAAGNRPVEVEFRPSKSGAKGIEVRYEAGTFRIENNPFSDKPNGMSLPRIVITHPL